MKNIGDDGGVSVVVTKQLCVAIAAQLVKARQSVEHGDVFKSMWTRSIQMSLSSLTSKRGRERGREQRVRRRLPAPEAFAPMSASHTPISNVSVCNTCSPSFSLFRSFTLSLPFPSMLALCAPTLDHDFFRCCPLLAISAECAHASQQQQRHRAQPFLQRQLRE